MKKNLIIFLMAVYAITVLSQEFVEITDYGWGQGMQFSKPAFIDLDNDGLLDLIVGEQHGHLYHHQTSMMEQKDSLLQQAPVMFNLILHPIGQRQL